MLTVGAQLVSQARSFDSALSVTGSHQVQVTDSARQYFIHMPHSFESTLPRHASFDNDRDHSKPRQACFANDLDQSKTGFLVPDKSVQSGKKPKHELESIVNNLLDIPDVVDKR